MPKTTEERIEDYKAALARHRGPFTLVVWRPVPKTPENRMGLQCERVKTDDPVDDMAMLLGDPRDTVTCVDVWSHAEQQYATQGRRRDFGFPELPQEGGTEDVAKKHTPAKQAHPKNTSAKPQETDASPAPAASRGREYEVADADFDPGRGGTAKAVWAFFKKHNPASVQTVFDKMAAQGGADAVKPSKDVVASCASTFKKGGGLK